MLLKLTGILGIWVLAYTVLAAADFWEDKDFTSWSEEEVEEILTDSPWSRGVTVVIREAGERTRGFGTGVVGDGDGGFRPVPDDESTQGRRVDGFGATPVRLTLTVSWRSALPVKQALARAQAGIGAPIPPAQQAFLIQHEPLYIVSVSGVPRELAEVINRKTLLEQTTLERDGKAPILAEDVEPFFQRDETVILEFAFLRDDPIALADEEVEFVTMLGETEVKRSFSLQDMMFGDALAM